MGAFIHGIEPEIELVIRNGEAFLEILLSGTGENDAILKLGALNEKVHFFSIYWRRHGPDPAIGMKERNFHSIARTLEISDITPGH